MICIIGAVALDLTACKKHFRTGTSNPAEIRFSLGGVGYRIFHHLRRNKSFISAVGSDLQGAWIEKQLSLERGVELTRVGGYASGCYLAFMESGQLKCAAADMKVIEEGLTLARVQESLPQLGEKDMLVMEANLSAPLVKALLQLYSSRTKCVFESVSVEKFLRHSESLAGL